VTPLGNLVWTMRDGQKIKLKDMSDNHLRATASMLRRRAADDLSSLYSAECMVSGDAATDAWESAVHDLDQRNIERSGLADAMEAVLQSRHRSAE
jgi:hypothetical protein